ncbi:MAG TPA: tripartite tricarboxylate transporter substrate binding protein [Burkholderiales bacterium]|nr:tripartite tricarboxylate transporter substrate binding protein [Burkholderiales bacterium]
MRVRAFAAAVAIAAGLGSAQTAPAQVFPSKSIRVVLLGSPGGSTDLLARAVSQHMSEAFGQQVVVDNRPGGGGIIAAEITAKANPDGHTTLWTHTSHTVLPSLHKTLPIEPIRDYAPVSLVALFPGVLVVNNALPVKSVKDLITLAHAQPGKLNYAAGTTGASAHLSGELLKLMAGVNIIHVPYKGTAMQLTSVISGESQMTFASLPAAMPHVQGGRVRALAIGSAKRSPVLPDLPTVSEAALPGFDVSAWNGILAPRRTPQNVIARLNREIARVVQIPEMKDRAAAQGAELVSNSPEEFSAYLAAQIEKWGKVVKAAGIRPD